MKLGPETICEKLEMLMDELEDIRKPSVEFLLNHKERVDDLHKVALVHSVESDVQIVVSVFSDGRTSAGITLSDPFSRSPSPYRMSVDPQVFSKAVGETFGWGVSEVKSGIFEFPPKVKFLSVVGDDMWLKKELFQEKIKGNENLSFAEKIDEGIFKRILDMRRNPRSSEIKVLIDDEGIHVAFLAPEYIDDKRLPLLSEMAKVVKEKLGIKTSVFSKISRGKRTFATATFPLEDLWKDRPLEDAEELMRKTLSGYEAFLKEAGLD